MESNLRSAPLSKPLLWVGWILSVLPVLMVVVSAVMKFVKPPELIEGFAHLGLDLRLAVGLGVLELACTILYLIPRTAVLGAILLTGYLGGAIATHLRVADPFFPPILLGVLLWGGLYVRDTRLRALLPLRR